MNNFTFDDIEDEYFKGRPQERADFQAFRQETADLREAYIWWEINTPAWQRLLEKLLGVK